MDIRQLSPTYAVSPQIDVADIPAIAEAGFTTIICNRPDTEVPPSHQAQAIEAAAQAAGLAFVTIPVTHQGLNMDMIMAQKDAMDSSDGPTLAYCASGTRSSIVWSFGQATEMPADDIIAATSAAGYDLGGMRAQLEALANRKGASGSKDKSLVSSIPSDFWSIPKGASTDSSRTGNGSASRSRPIPTLGVSVIDAPPTDSMSLGSGKGMTVSPRAPGSSVNCGMGATSSRTAR